MKNLSKEILSPIFFNQCHYTCCRKDNVSSVLTMKLEPHVLSDILCMMVRCVGSICLLQSNLNSSKTDGSFTMANSNSFVSPYGILSIPQENK